MCVCTSVCAYMCICVYLYTYSVYCVHVNVCMLCVVCVKHCNIVSLSGHYGAQTILLVTGVFLASVAVGLQVWAARPCSCSSISVQSGVYGLLQHCVYTSFILCHIVPKHNIQAIFTFNLTTKRNCLWGFYATLTMLTIWNGFLVGDGFISQQHKNLKVER